LNRSRMSNVDMVDRSSIYYIYIISLLIF
jgi:hypothetical protein